MDGVYYNLPFVNGGGGSSSKNSRIASALAAGGSDAYGSYSAKYDDCPGIPIALLLTTVLGLGVMIFALYTKITMAGRRRRKRSSGLFLEEVEEEEDVEGIAEKLHGFAIGGILTADAGAFRGGVLAQGLCMPHGAFYLLCCVHVYLCKFVRKDCQFYGW